MLVERRELHGDEVVELLDGAKLVMPEIDYATRTLAEDVSPDGSRRAAPSRS